MSDPTTRLLAAIVKAERAASEDMSERRPHGPGCGILVSDWDHPVCDCGYAATVLRRCAADRKLIELHEPVHAGTPYEAYNCGTCVRAGDIAEKYPDDWSAQSWPCDTIRALADGYDIAVEAP